MDGLNGRKIRRDKLKKIAKRIQQIVEMIWGADPTNCTPYKSRIYSTTMTSLAITRPSSLASKVN
jgi:hypothetical protein